MGNGRLTECPAIEGKLRGPLERQNCEVLAVSEEGSGLPSYSQKGKSMDTEGIPADTNDTLLQLVTFAVGSEKFGIDILHVEEIMKMVQITRLPGSPDVIEGIINLRGKVIPVMDIRMKMHLPRKEYDSDTRIIVTETRGETVGMIVDSVTEVLRIPSSLTEPPPDIISGIDSRFVSSIGKLENKMLILIDVEKLMGSGSESVVAAAEEVAAP